MSALIMSGKRHIQNSVAFSRNLDEQIRSVEGNEHYTGMAALIAYNIDEIDAAISAISDYVGKFASTETLHAQYFNPKRLFNIFSRKS